MGNVVDDTLPPAVAAARARLGLQVSGSRGVLPGEDAEPVGHAEESGPVGQASSSGCGGESCLAGLETLQRRRRDAPWLSCAAREPKRLKPTLSVALSIAASEEQMSVARSNFDKLVYASGTRAAKDSHWAVWSQLCSARGLSDMPLSPQSIREVGAVMRRAGYRSAYSYLLDAKLEHIRKGHVWSEMLEMAMRDAKRALSRGLGGAEKSDELQLEWLALLPDVGRPVELQPEGGPLLWAVGIHFILREVELATVMLADVSFDLGARRVTLMLPVSKTDAQAKGCRRTLACLAPSATEDCEGIMCPYCSTLKAVRRQMAATGVDTNMAEADVVPLMGQTGDPLKVVDKGDVIAAAREDALWLLNYVPEACHIDPERISGHFMRRTGCKRLARDGVPREAIKHLARHSSAAVDGYIEEAAEECPGARMWAQNQIDMTRRLECLSQKQDEMNDRLKVQEDAAWTAEDVLACVEKATGKSSSSWEPCEPEKLEAIVSREAKAAAHKAAFPSFVYNFRTKKLHRIALCHVQVEPERWTTVCGWPWIASRGSCRVLVSESEAPADYITCDKCIRGENRENPKG